MVLALPDGNATILCCASAIVHPDGIGGDGVVIIAGMDEAGYGPLLGPLVVSATVFEIPDDRADECLWDVLRDSVTRTVRKRDPRLPIADSKKLFTRGQGFHHLERGALCALAMAGVQPKTFEQLLGSLAPDVPGAARSYPWYQTLDIPIPVECTSAELGMQCNALRHSLSACGGRFVGALCEPLLEGHYNRLVEKTRNKSVVLLGLTLRLIRRVTSQHPDQPIRFYIDRQGGRTNYSKWLMTSFEDFSLKIIEESDDRSAYQMVRRPAEWRVEFAKSGEKHYLPVALASMFSKYIRELFMGGFNRYWCGQIADRKPTAGYYTDGMRFLSDIQPHIERLGVDRSILIRQL